MTLDRSTIWPYEDGEPGAFYYQRYGHPTGAEAERALGELENGTALLFPSGAGATTALVLSQLAPGDTIALAEGCYFGTSVLFRDARALGAPIRRVRPDRAAARGRPARLARGAVEPVPDDARPRGGGGAPGPRRRRLDRRDADLPAPARARRRLRAPLRDEVPRGPRRRAARRRRLPRPAGGDAAPRLPHGDRDRRRARPGLAAPARARDPAPPRRAPDRDRARAGAAARGAPGRRASSATRASAASSRSTSPTPRLRGGSRPASA